MTGMYQNFVGRANRIPFLGLGLSVDVYSPDIFELCEELRFRRIPIEYLEIFHANPKTLESVRAQMPDIPLAYHVEGLWFSQPDWETRNASKARLEAAARDLRILQAHWVNQECATKEIAGFFFGTYLPPILTGSSAAITAYHAQKAQQMFDQCKEESLGESPLLLLEGPPLSFFSMGNMTYAEYFLKVTTMAPCGLVLDIGHVWTVYRYTEAWKSQRLESFFEAFLDQFPLERVIQIHIAGLACHPHIIQPLSSEESENPPLWIDAHEAPIPQELLELLARLVRDPRLINLKGVALEVDNKPISLICREIILVREMLEPLFHSGTRMTAWEDQREDGSHKHDNEFSMGIWHKLTRQYMDYVELVTGKGESRFVTPTTWQEKVGEELDYYVHKYLPYEIISWGGDVREMFPQTCQLLMQHNIPLHLFVEFWFSHSRESVAVYDFFLLKIQLFEEFLDHVLPLANSLVKQEAELLFQSYVMACQRAR